MSDFSSTTRFFELSRRDVCYVKFILEAYDGLATMSTVDSRRAVVAVTVPDSRASDGWALMQALCGETGMKEVPDPAALPPHTEATEPADARTA